MTWYHNGKKLPNNAHVINNKNLSKLIIERVQKFNEGTISCIGREDDFISESLASLTSKLQLNFSSLFY